MSEITKPIMSDDSRQLDAERLSRALLRFDAKALGLAVGLLLGLLVSFLTLWTILTATGAASDVEQFLRELERVFWGYSVSAWGAFIGFLYGFAIGTLTGTATGHLYNFFSGLRRAMNHNQRDE